MPTYTKAELTTDGLPFAMELLIAAARAGEPVTYQRLADHLAGALGKDGISARHMGPWVAGPLMDFLLEDVDPKAPLINLLVVRADSKKPGDGAEHYLKDRFKPRGQMSQKEQDEFAQTALNQIRTYQDWDGLFERAFGRGPERLETHPNELEEDGQGDNPRYGGLPESEEHKALKLFVLNNPARLRLNLRDPVGTVESRLLSGDEMDVEFVDGPRRIGVEVKSRRSGRADHLRGIYQCVKYRAVMIAQSGFDASEAQCEAVLVTEAPLDRDLQALADRLAVPHRQIRIS